MNHITSIGLDVHARSITAVALDSITGEVHSQKFDYSPSEVASWILSFDSPKAVYESGVTGFHLVRELREFGVDCIVGAVSKMIKPPADKRKKNDRGVVRVKFIGIGASLSLLGIICQIGREPDLLMR